MLIKLQGERHRQKLIATYYNVETFYLSETNDHSKRY